MSILVGAYQLSLFIPDLVPGQSYQFAVRAWNADGPGAATWANVVVPYWAGAPSPLTPTQPQPDPGGWTVNWGTYNGWSFGWDSPWAISSVDGFPDMASLKTQDSEVLGDGQIFAYQTADWEEKRVITMEFDGGQMLLEDCYPPPPGAGFNLSRIQDARCALMRRQDDLPLVLNDEWLVMARPRRFLAPQRAGALPTLTVSWEAQDPAIYSTILQSGTVGLGESTLNRPYPIDVNGNLVAGLQYRGPAGTVPGSWRYAGDPGGGALQVNNEGCRRTFLVCRITGPVTDPIIFNETTNQFVEFNLTLAAGEFLLVDFRLGLVLLNGTANRSYAVTRDSSWFSIPPEGTAYVRFLSPGATDPAASLYAEWRSAW